ncbi:hypothetical protein [Variovorax sp.]|uniref:hypothetical protein n=1 Tax=Variovorax sp. TaxID=1871043 RepID=UPI0025DBF675|nr:hypothetical protein [Variovorax sp.]
MSRMSERFCSTGTTVARSLSSRRRSRGGISCSSLASARIEAFSMSLPPSLEAGPTPRPTATAIASSSSSRSGGRLLPAPSR